MNTKGLSAQQIFVFCWEINGLVLIKIIVWDATYDANDYFLLYLSNICIFPFKAAVSCLLKEYWPVLQILTDLADPPGTSFCGRVLEQVCL